MYNLTRVITSFNQIYRKKISLNKNWGLFYLQSENLALLNRNAQLIQDCANYASPFSIKGLHTTSAKKKPQSVREQVPFFHDAFRKITINQTISQRSSWEGRFLATLNNDQVWIDVGKKINQESESIKHYFLQMRRNWDRHKSFQYHSSEGLLCLLNFIVKYQYLFYQASKELQRKKRTWIPFRCLPSFIAESYGQFLAEELDKFMQLRARVLDALLLRLQVIEQQSLVVYDDVSYVLALRGRWLGLPISGLPDYRLTLNTDTFNHIQRAIEKHGAENHTKQLYQLAWYRPEKMLKELTTITTSRYCLLVPKPLFVFMPRKEKKWFRFFSNHRPLQFLERQQALLTQLCFQSVVDSSMLVESASIKFYPELITLSTQYQLLQQSRDDPREQECLYWWQWGEKRWKIVWQTWLEQQFEKKQASLLTCLDKIDQEVNIKTYIENNRYSKQVKVILGAIQALRNEGIAKMWR